MIHICLRDLSVIPIQLDFFQSHSIILKVANELISAFPGEYTAFDRPIRQDDDFTIATGCISYDYIESSLVKHPETLGFIFPIDTSDNSFNVPDSIRTVRMVGTFILDLNSPCILEFSDSVKNLNLAFKRNLTLKDAYLMSTMDTLSEINDSVEKLEEQLKIKMQMADVLLSPPDLEVNDSDYLLMNTYDPSIPFEKYYKQKEE